MSTLTTNYGFTKPALNADSGAWGGMLNNSLDAIDADLKSVSNVANAALPQAGGTLSGLVNAHTMTMARSNVPTTIGTITLDLSAAQAFTVSLTGAAVFAFATPAGGTVAQGFVLRLTNGGGSPAPTWPNTVRWAGGSPPAFSTGTDLLAFITFDNGANYYGVLVAKDLR